MVKTIDSSTGIRAWETEVSKYFHTGGKAQVDANKLPLVGRRSFREFLNEVDDRGRILVGSKGLGKSTGLARKAVQLKNDGYRIAPMYHPYIVLLQEINIDIHEDEYSKYREHGYWSVLWKMVIATVLVIEINNKAVLNKGLQKVLGCAVNKSAWEVFETIGKKYQDCITNRQDYVTPIIDVFLRRNFSQNQIHLWLGEFVYPKLKVTQGEYHAIILDQVDQAFRRYHDKQSDLTEGVLSVWEAVQTGLVDAVGEMQDIGAGSFSIYAAIRSEAYRKYALHGRQNKAQVSSYCVELNYDNDLLEEIFNLNVKLTERNDLAIPDAPSHAKRYIGVTEFRNINVPGTTETVVQWLVRHTFGSPRELVWHGKRISENIPPAKRGNRNTMSRTVNETADNILRDYLAEMVPPWDSSVEIVYESLVHCVLSKVQIEDISKRYKDKFGRCPIRYLYSCGLIGYANSGTQSFLNISRTGNENLFPDAAYYLLHPCLYNRVIEKLSAEDRAGFISHSIVVGNNLECPEEIYKPRLVLYHDMDQQTAWVSQIPEDGGWNPSMEIIRSNRIDALTISPDCEDTGVLFSFAMLLCVSERKKKNPTVKELCQVFSWLVEKGLVPQVPGAGTDRDYTVSFFNKALNDGDLDESPIKKALTVFDSLSIGENKISVKVQSGKDSVIGYSLTGVSSGEVQRRYSLLRK